MTPMASVSSPRPFAAPADLAPRVLSKAETLWDAICDDGPGADGDTDRLAELLGLDTGDGHDELTRCEAPGCDAWHWADEGGRVLYESGRGMQMCPVHAVPDDPGARVFPGAGLEAQWRADEQAAISASIRATGRAW